MSDKYVTGTDTAIVTKESDVYDKGLDVIIGLSIVSFTIGFLTLIEIISIDISGEGLTQFFVTLLIISVGGCGAVILASWGNIVSVNSQRIQGVIVSIPIVMLALTGIIYLLDFQLNTVLGFIILAKAAGILAAGVSSRLDLIDTSPDSSAGLLAASAFGVIGLFVGAAIGGSLVGFDSLFWPIIALLVSIGLITFTVLPREDLGSTLAPSLILGVLGLTITTATIGVGWQWNPENLSGTFTGGTVIPIFMLFSAIVSSWAAAKCRANFGAQGREYGAFLVINLNAFMMLAVMIAIVFFVTIKGIGYAFHGLKIGAFTALIMLAPIIVLTLRYGKLPAISAGWYANTRRILPIAVLGSIVAVPISILLTGKPLVYSYTYTVYSNQEAEILDTAIKLTPEFTVGGLILALSSGILFVYFYRKYGSPQNIGTQLYQVDIFRKAIPIIISSLILLAVLSVIINLRIFNSLMTNLATLIILAGCIATLTVVSLPLIGILLGRGRVSELAKDRTPLVKLGVFGGLGLLTATFLFQQVAVINSFIDPTNLLSTVSIIAAVFTAGLAVLTTYISRKTEDVLNKRLISEEKTLALAGSAGFVTLAGLDVWLSKSTLTLFGISISKGGMFSWPMAMQGYIPLGLEPGGIMPAVVGTVWLVIGAILFAVPLGVGAGIFLTEYAEQGRFTAIAEVATNALWSTPSIVFGLFGAAFLIPRFGGDTSLLAGMLVLGFMLLPLVLITSREAIKAVPKEYRDASAALGVTRWQTIRSVVLPAAMPGIITGGILGTGRIAGETAPLILVLGSTLNATESVHVLRGFRFVDNPPFIVNDQLLAASASLPTQVWAIIAAGVSGSPSRGWATAFILLMVVLMFYAVGITARTYFRRRINYE